ncbi:putative O-glycosylation ligase, exosortase A system-associated [Candidatus Thiodictyon syntrophicum]|jgi:probable O-glycosylation ligase (exosortase A-associated)|uniref:Putative O-glycosylation ligase, exosortase A system-associated n=1 Tax=Candidatus Thiodictyon syntrophicum TaxID=1166950 RepID=A0A2K8UC70_9GAMM|nr:putative O-glycosylation ligase, exosortase A system-associated [Candidatus Thiodictyon syntrophicum]AUB83202.1 putative O-glycosylation ligase, exosortase A system-associated [Candidatus Thiodictyon syntrophicum]
MRDLFVTLVVFGSIPLILRKPFFGVLIGSWLGLMNPHILCWSFAAGKPFALIVALTLILSFLISKEPKRLPASALVGLLGFWWFWLFVTTLTAFYPDTAWDYWDRAWRIMLLTFLTIVLLTSRERIDALVWTCVISLGFYGVKGGIFTLLGGGASHVNGPAGTFIGGNNEIGLALVMTIPLIRYLQLTSTNRWVRYAMMAAMGLCVVAVLGTQSRGALLGLMVMILYLAVKTRNRAGLLLLLALSLPLAFMIMPESWYSRMDTIQAYDQDASALGRINAWWTAWYLALEHPFVGGGFNVFLRPTFIQYAPNPRDVHDAHSIYFQVLGQQGFVGLFTFLGIMFGSFVSLNRIRKFARSHEQLQWMGDLSSMVFVSIIGYATSGAFLGLAMFDYYYTLVAITIGLTTVAHRYAAQGVPEIAEVAPRPVIGVAVGAVGAAANRFAPPRRWLLGAIAGWFGKL